MFQNNLKIALRSLRKNKAYTFINVAGLAIGAACCMLILLFVAHELRYDRWNPNAERIYRPVADIKFGGSEFKLAVVGSVVGPDVVQALPEVQAYCRFRQNGSCLVKRDGLGQPNIREEDVLTTDSSFFEVFPAKLLEGDPLKCLTQPHSVAISKSRAEKFFGSPQLALGQTLVLDNRERWQVSGVFEDLPVATHFKADFLLAINGNQEVKEDPPLWATSNNFQTYLLLRKGADPESFKAKFAALSREKINETGQRMMGTTLEELEKTGQHARYNLQWLPDIHLHSDLTAEFQPNGNIQYVWIFSAIAAFILLIACINFMNLSTARSAHRAREIGVRKVLGSQRSALIRQFLSETTLLAALAMALAVLITATALPAFSDLTNRPMEMPWSQPLFWISIVASIGVIGIMAGIYPAFFLSAFDAIKVLKSQTTGRAGGGRLRSALVVFQFSTAIVLIIATALVYQQMNFIQHKKLGFQKEQVLIIDDAYALGDNIQAFKQDMLNQPGVEAASVSGFLPVPSNRNDNTFSKIREFREDQSVNMQNWRVDKDYLKTLGLELKTGRYFDPAAHPSDSTAIVLNERAAELFGYPDQPIGKKVYGVSGRINGQPKPEDFVEYTVIGVVKNFHFASLRDNIGALSLSLGNSTGAMTIRYQATESQSLIAAMERSWKTMAPEQPFGYRFMDDAFARMYAAEQRIGTIAGIFAILAVLISCLGLFGLAAFTAEQRTKEIGVRKVLGASLGGIIGLLSQDFLKLVFISLVVATPPAWYFMHRWLENFAFRVEIKWWVFALAGFAAVVIAVLTVGYQSVKAALANPVKSLRSE